MWSIGSYHDFLSENTGRHHTIGSSLIVLAVIGILVLVFT
jgi:hypothetical protein